MAVATRENVVDIIEARKSGKGVEQAVDVDAIVEKLGLTPSDLLHTYQQMLDIRHFEEQCNARFARAKSAAICICTWGKKLWPSASSAHGKKAIRRSRLTATTPTA